MAENKDRPRDESAIKAGQQEQSHASTQALQDRPLHISLSQLQPYALADCSVAQIAAALGCSPEMLERDYGEEIRNCRLRGQALLNLKIYQKAVREGHWPAQKLLWAKNRALELEEAERERREAERRDRENQPGFMHFNPEALSAMNEEQIEKIQAEWRAELKKLTQPIIIVRPPEKPEK